MRSLLLLLWLWLSLSVPGRSQLQAVTLWDQWTAAGRPDYPMFAVAAYYVDNLVYFDFDDVISAVCIPNGLWFLYEDASYNQGTLGGVAVFYSDDNSCFPLPESMNNKTTSLRFAGKPTDYKLDSLQLYEQANYGGRESYHVGDAADIGIPEPQSFVVTGASSWTLYSSAYYQGESVCLSAGADASQPGLYPTTELDWPLVASVRKGCHSTAAQRPAPLPLPLPLSH